MIRWKTMRLVAALCLGLMLCFFAVANQARAAINFSNVSDYDNTENTVVGTTPDYNQTTGLFRDVFWWKINNGLPAPNTDLSQQGGTDDFINRGNSLILVANHATPGAGPYTALNFTGPSVGGGQTYLSIYDTTPGDGTATRNLFNATGGLQVSADVLFVKHNASGGLVSLYNEGQDGLALLINNRDGNNTDFAKLSLVFQSPGVGTVLLSTPALPAATFVAGNWYRLVMDLSVTAPDSYSVLGTVYKHLTETDPTSALGALITSLSYSGSLSSPGNALDLTNPGEIGLVAQGNESISLPDNVGVSITNFDFSTLSQVEEPVPEPASLAIWGSIGLIGLVAGWRRRGKQAI